MRPFANRICVSPTRYDRPSETPTPCSNVGAGTGNYEPHDLDVVAVEPSTVMIAQRPAGSAPVVRGVAESLPFAAGAFDVALAVLTVHHWADLAAGLREMRRVASTQVVLLFDRSQVPPFWLHEYFPQPDDLSMKRSPPGVTDLAQTLAVQEVQPVPIPRDCTDGFGEASWARPHAYTDPAVQSGMSWLAMLPPDLIRQGTARLQQDLATGRWDEEHGWLRHEPSYDGGHRLVIARG